MEQLFNWAVGVLGAISMAVVSWTVKQILGHTKSINDMKLSQLEDKLWMSEHFSKKSDTDKLEARIEAGFNKMREDLSGSLQRLYDKIEGLGK